jgi:hypothetical protein
MHENKTPTELNMSDVPDSVWSMCMVIRLHTQDNHHTLAVKELADRYGDGWHQTNVIKAIATISDYESETPDYLIDLRNKILASLLAKAECELNQKEYQALKASF